ncbi:MAG: hypothetical protein IJ147_11900, partial [Lachnospiraceae bacterium]|nr:hypothetical protein [Lachnospiraceae bacterium]
MQKKNKRLRSRHLFFLHVLTRKKELRSSGLSSLHEIASQFQMRKGHARKDDNVSAMFKGDIKSMNRYMNRVALNTFSYF